MLVALFVVGVDALDLYLECDRTLRGIGVVEAHSSGDIVESSVKVGDAKVLDLEQNRRVDGVNLITIRSSNRGEWEECRRQQQEGEFTHRERRCAFMYAEGGACNSVSMSR